MEKKLSIEELLPGMKLSKPVYIEGTQIVLVNKGETLDSSNINVLKQLGISCAFIFENSMLPEAVNITPVCDQIRRAEKILVVDDEADICQYIKEVLENSGYQVECAYGADDAWKVLFDDPDINTVFLDLMMPEVSGFDLLKKIRGELKRNVSVVVVTAKKSMQDIIAVKEFGISGYITKPFDPQKLVVVAGQASSKDRKIM